MGDQIVHRLKLRRIFDDVIVGQVDDVVSAARLRFGSRRDEELIGR
jgi:hypothetical protein